MMDSSTRLRFCIFFSTARDTHWVSSAVALKLQDPLPRECVSPPLSDASPSGEDEEDSSAVLGIPSGTPFLLGVYVLMLC